MGPQEYLNIIFRDHESEIRFQPSKGKWFKTVNDLDKYSIEKVRSILEIHGITPSIKRKKHTNLTCVFVKRNAIPKSILNLSAQLRVDKRFPSLKSLSVEDIIQTFSWKHYSIVCGQKPRLLSHPTDFRYDKHHRPLFDEKWAKLANKLTDQDSLYERPSDYIIKAQMYTQRFFTQFPALLKKDYISLHPAILLTGILLAFQASDECNIDHQNIISKLLEPKLPKDIICSLVKDLIEMERKFLQAIHYEIQFEEPLEHAMGLHLSPSFKSAKTLLINSEIGTYSIQKIEDEFVFSVVLDPENGEINQKRFKINSNRMFAETSGKDLIPQVHQSLTALIAQWGGVFPLPH